MSVALVDSPSILRGFSAAIRRKIHVLAVFCCAWAFLFLALAPSSFADDKTPQDEYEASLKDSYTEVFANAEVSEKQVSSFISCLSDATYDDLSATTIQALTAGNLDYEVSSEEADVFLNGVETCLADNDLSDVVVAPGSEEVDEGDGGVSDVETDGNAAQSETSAKEAPTYLLPLATGLTLLAIIALAFYLIMRGKARNAQEMAMDGSTES